VWYVSIGVFISFAFIPYPDTMTIKPDKNKKMAVGIYLTTIFESISLCYKEVNEYIDALKQQIEKLQKANKELAMLQEKETAKEKEL
jgi:hypothetical protein